MQRQGHRRHAPGPSRQPVDLVSMREQVQAVLVEALDCVAPSRVTDIVRGWLGRLDLSSFSPEAEAALRDEALGLARLVAVFTPASGGTTAIERLGRRRKAASPAFLALGRAQFRLMTVDRVEEGASAWLQDAASAELIRIEDEAMRAVFPGLALGLWLAPLLDGRHVVVGPVTPLDEPGLAVGSGFVRPGRPGLVNPVRCAEAVYQHVVRDGTLRIPGLNEPDEDGDEFDRLALLWAEPGPEPDPADVQFVRDETRLSCLLALLDRAAEARGAGRPGLSAAYASMAQIQLETVQRRVAAGTGTLRPDGAAAAVEAEIAAGRLLPGAREIFAALRFRRDTGPGARPGGASEETDKLVGRIQALRAKTVAQGCTEQEALAAAAKVAELLDRYGLSLSEFDLRDQPCAGDAVETARKRSGPIDDCVPPVAAFFDCRVWGEKSDAGTLRYVFFGLPADVAAARYLYDLVDQAFDRETSLFKAGPAYGGVAGTMRRIAVNSFQLGLGRGIAAKLGKLRTARETALRHSSGRDLVVLKADIVDAELATLGLRFRAASRTSGRRLMPDAFDQGHALGLDFEVVQGIPGAR